MTAGVIGNAFIGGAGTVTAARQDSPLGSNTCPGWQPLVAGSAPPAALTAGSASATPGTASHTTAAISGFIDADLRLRSLRTATRYDYRAPPQPAIRRGCRPSR